MTSNGIVQELWNYYDCPARRDWQRGDVLEYIFVAQEIHTSRDDGELFVSDLLAGITVGLVALPPQTGLYCAIIAGFAISALGGSSTW